MSHTPLAFIERTISLAQYSSGPFGQLAYSVLVPGNRDRFDEVLVAKPRISPRDECRLPAGFIGKLCRAHIGDQNLRRTVAALTRPASGIALILSSHATSVASCHGQSAIRPGGVP